MKTFSGIFLLLALLLASSLHAQDVITLKKGKTIEGKVIEVTPTKVKYKKASNPEGPTYRLAKSDHLWATSI